MKKNELKQYYYHNKDAKQTWEIYKKLMLNVSGKPHFIQLQKKGLKLNREFYNNKWLVNIYFIWLYVIVEFRQEHITQNNRKISGEIGTILPTWWLLLVAWLQAALPLWICYFYIQLDHNMILCMITRNVLVSNNKSYLWFNNKSYLGFE